MKIREASISDKEKFIELAAKADKRDSVWAEQKFDSFVLTKKKRKLIFAEDNGKLIGFAAIKGEELGENVSEELNMVYLLLNWIAVLPEYRSKKIGSKLLLKCEKYVKKWNKKGIWTGCRTKVIPFYERNGYKHEGTFINNNGKEENLMRKKMR
jgi:GNAT superfamily N-acetyltransferase